MKDPFPAEEVRQRKMDDSTLQCTNPESEREERRWERCIH